MEKLGYLLKGQLKHLAVTHSTKTWTVIKYQR